MARGDDPVPAAPDHLRGHRELAERQPVDAPCWPPAKVSSIIRLSAALVPCHALELEHVLPKNHFARDHGRIGDRHSTPAANCLRRLALHRSRRCVAMLISGPSPAEQIRVGRGDPLGMVERQVEGDSATKRMTDQMRARDPLGVKEIDHRHRQRADVTCARARSFARPRPRQVDGVGGITASSLLIELPVVEIAAEAVQETIGGPSPSPRQVTKAAAARLDRFRLGRRRPASAA